MLTQHDTGGQVAITMTSMMALPFCDLRLISMLFLSRPETHSITILLLTVLYDTVHYQYRH